MANRFRVASKRKWKSISDAMPSARRHSAVRRRAMSAQAGADWRGGAGHGVEDVGGMGGARHARPQQRRQRVARVRAAVSRPRQQGVEITDVGGGSSAGAERSPAML